MADVTSRVRFLGDAAQLLATYKAIGAQATALQRQINAVNNAGFGARGLTPASGKLRDTIPDNTPIIRKVRTEVDSLNKTMRIFGETAIHTKKYGDVITGTYEEVRGNTEQLINATQRLDKATRVGQRAGRQYVDQASIINANRDATLRNARALKIREAAEKANARSMAAAGVPLRTASGAYTTLSGKLREITNAYRLFDSRGRSASLARFTSEINDQAKAARQALPQLTRLAQVGGAITAARGAQEAALLAAPPTPASITQLGKLSPQLLKKLQQQGLSTDAAGLYRQRADVSFEKDLVRGVTRINGSFVGANDVVQRFNAELDRSGKLVTRFGGHLSGLQNFLNQTVRNLQKVVQWGIATTAVFAGVGLAVRELSVLGELNTNLNRLGVTANLTREETNKLFGDLANIAISTATPLTELTKSADDIALAVRESGKSSQDFTRDILNMTQAVGIYTNLTGADTVQATDLLTSSMKQLGLGTEDVTGLLSKITAVAGGQSNAISDITQGLAAMAEAATNAGLSVDRTIATVQILSQVTAKSPSEIATSFKNLVGALENPAGIKQLNALNIKLISDGNNIIDIYREIAEQVRTGAIASTEVSGVLRNLAGGPRRAPDAAALLSNIDKIAQTEARAIRATNEALIVNAKVLDTVQAKITQLQAKFDKVVFEKFSEGFVGAVEAVSGALTVLLSIIENIPTGLISTAIQFGLLLAAMRLGIGVVRVFTSALGGLYTSLRGLPAAFAAARAASQAPLFTVGGLPLGVGGGGGVGGKFGKFGGGAGIAGIAGGAALGALIGSGSGSPLGALAGGLSGLGLGALTAPVPLPWLKLGGAIAFAAGTLLTFVDGANDAEKSAEDTARSAEKALNAFSKYDEARLALEDYEKTQKNLRETMATLSKEQEKTPENLASMRDAQGQYISNTIAMADASLQLSAAMKEIAAASPDLGRAIQAVRDGIGSAGQIEQEIQALQLQLLRQTDPNAQLPGNVGIVQPQRAPIVPFQQGSPVGGGNYARLPGSTTVINSQGANEIANSLNLNELKDEAAKVKQLFDETGQSIVGAFAPTGENISLVSQAIQQLKKDNDPLAASLENTFTSWVQQKSAVDGAALAIASYQSRIDALKFFDPQAAGELQKLLDLTSKTIALATEQGNGASIYAAQQEFFDMITGKTPIDEQGIKGLLDLFSDVSGLTVQSEINLFTGFAESTETAEQAALRYQGIIESLGIDMDFLKNIGTEALQGITEETIAALEAMEEFRASTAANAAEESARVQAQIQGGEFKGDEANGRAQLDYWAEVSETVNQVAVQYDELATIMGGNLDPAVQEFAGTLTNINGLQDAQQLTTQQLIERMFGLADTYGLTSVEVDKLGGKLGELFTAIKRLNEIRGMINIGANVDASALIKFYKIANKGTPHINAATGFIDGWTGGGGYSGIISELEGIQSSFGSIGGSIGNIYGGAGGSGTYKGPSKGSSGSKASKTAQGPDVSTLDLPEEIANASNRDALIALAIKNAKKLQGLIPGASAEGKNDIVELLKGTQHILEVKGIKDDLLRKALEELADIEKKRLEQETKADTIRRIRVGAGSFAAIANVPLNSRTGVSVGGAGAGINVTLNLNGTVLTPAQFAQFADMIGASIKRQIAS